MARRQIRIQESQEEDDIQVWIDAGAPTHGETWQEVLKLRQQLAGVDAPPPSDPNRLLTVAEAAKRERCSTRQVYRWLTSRELDGHKVGRHWRIAPAALDRRRIEAAKPKTKAAAPKKRRSRRKAAPAAKTDWPD